MALVPIAAATKNYFIKPQDGWVEIVTGAGTPINYLRISAVPHTHPIRIYAGASAPASTVDGILVCHDPFVFHDDSNGTSTLFFVRNTNPCNSSQKADGSVRIDVFSEGGVLQ